MSTHGLRRSERGQSLIELVVALGVMAIALTGLLALQLTAKRTNSFGAKLSIATELARDMLEAAERWEYNDPRLNASSMVTSLSDTSIAAWWKGGLTGQGAPMTAQYGEPAATELKDNLGNNVNFATSAAAMGGAWDGLSSDIDGDGKKDFYRYWNVWGVDLSSTGVPQGKLILVVVRFRLGDQWRSVVMSTTKSSPEAAVQ